MLTFIDPKIALYNESRIKIKDLTDIAVRAHRADWAN